MSNLLWFICWFAVGFAVGSVLVALIGRWEARESRESDGLPPAPVSPLVHRRRPRG